MPYNLYGVKYIDPESLAHLAGHVVSKRPEHVLNASKKTQLDLAEFADPLGDVYLEETDARQLASLFARNRPKFVGKGTRADFAEIESEIYEIRGAPLFRSCVMYVIGI